MLRGNSSRARNDHFVDGRGDINVDVVLEMSGVFSVLVPDIFLNIMSRVPLKSLSQCRWVCKGWYNLIKSPSFATIQFEWAVTNNSPWVFFWTSNQDFYLVDDQVFDHNETSAIAHSLELNEFKRAFQVGNPGKLMFSLAGYVNGLLCFATDFGFISDFDPDFNNPCLFYICNPVTGEHITIPKLHKYGADEISAFGFVPTTSEYKVIRFLEYVDEDGEYLGSEGEVYTLGSSEWRKIEDAPRITDIVQWDILVNGNLHWTSLVSDSQIIVAFNVGAEKFDVIQLPPCVLQKDLRLGVVEGHLCCIHKDIGCNPYEIWVMNDYGVQSSWVKKYSICWNLTKWFWFGSRDLMKLRNGELLLPYDVGDAAFMAYYHPKRETLRPIRVNRRLEYDVRPVIQVGTLFSPKDIGKSREKKV